MVGCSASVGERKELIYNKTKNVPETLNCLNHFPNFSIEHSVNFMISALI